MTMTSNFSDAEAHVLFSRDSKVWRWLVEEARRIERPRQASFQVTFIMIHGEGALGY